ncbi:hypothetical protein MPSEU_000493600 [Mayamaea pseudoterrestris]|nr:hypothetical protein MPSEU_000493600 [Mayamaea pseudoterrestris]
MEALDGKASSFNIDNTMVASSAPSPLHVLQCYLASVTPCDKEDNHAIQQETHDQLLRVADFLYNSCMEGALSILDHEPPLITQVVSAASQRSLYLVQGSSHKSRSSNETYLCYTSPDVNDSLSMHHCSCRSFWERSRNSGSATLCKHLLALHLLPGLNGKFHTLQIASDEEFANIVLSRLRINY